LTELVSAGDEHFAWLLGEAPAPDGLRLPPGGLDEPDILRWARRQAASIRPVHSDCAWLIVSEGEVVGLCSYKGPAVEGVVEIGYGIAESRRQRGHATGAVARLVAVSAVDPLIKALSAETAVTNTASQRVLEANGFVRTGERFDASDGWVSCWHHNFGET
jgi:RimJ/RimL family protein N-acetyltransferase